MQKPENRISIKAIQVYRLARGMADIIILFALSGLLWAGYFFSWPTWLKVFGWVGIGILPLVAIWSIIISPILLQRYWRYGVDQDFVRLKSGRFNLVDTVIPMTKVQYVEAEQGPILRRYGLYTLTVGTMRSAHEIPALPEEEAFRVRDLIAYHAKIVEDDE